jgi:hypothetical protein
MTKLSKIKDFKDYLRIKDYVSTVMIENWGVTHGYLRARRTARDLAEVGVNQMLIPLSNEEAIKLGFLKADSAKIRWYEVIK